MVPAATHRPILSALTLVLVLALGATGCVDRSQFLEIGGGGFIFNYRNAEATFGLILVPRRDPPEGAVIEVSLENPAGGSAILLSRPARGGGRIEFTSPALSGIRKAVPYQVVVVLRGSDGAELQRLEKTFSSDVDQSVLPERPLAIGPGYQRNIDDSESPFPPSINSVPPRQPR